MLAAYDYFVNYLNNSEKPDSKTKVSKANADMHIMKNITLFVLSIFTSLVFAIEAHSPGLQELLDKKQNYENFFKDSQKVVGNLIVFNSNNQQQIVKYINIRNALGQLQAHHNQLMKLNEKLMVCMDKNGTAMSMEEAINLSAKQVINYPNYDNLKLFSRNVKQSPDEVHINIISKLEHMRRVELSKNRVDELNELYMQCESNNNKGQDEDPEVYILEGTSKSFPFDTNGNSLIHPGKSVSD